MAKDSFPEGFLWGAATSAHQVEGGNLNDWTEWEKQGRVKNKQQSGRATDHWNRYEADFDLLQKLNLNAYRMSIEWSRIEPAQGSFDTEAVEHYKVMLRSLKQRGITPCVTLHHFTNPTWLGGWSNGRSVKYFLNYVQFIIEQLGPNISLWQTINEPSVYIAQGYLRGAWPPGKHNPVLAWLALRNLLKAHCKAYKLIHSIYHTNSWPNPKVSMAFNLLHFKPTRLRIISQLAKYVTNSFILKRVYKQLDFIGLNYYFSYDLRVLLPKKYNGPKSDLGWAIKPDGLLQILVDLKKYNLPVIVTENGLADAGDRLRPSFVVNHLTAIKHAVTEGVDVRGYFYWSLLDNFEWLDGYSARFGLVEIDYKTLRRKVRPSALLYAKIAGSNKLSETALKEYS